MLETAVSPAPCRHRRSTPGLPAFLFLVFFFSPSHPPQTPLKLRPEAGRGELLGPPGKFLSAMLIPALAEILPERFPGTRRSGAPIRGHAYTPPPPQTHPRSRGRRFRNEPPRRGRPGFAQSEGGRTESSGNAAGKYGGKDQPSASVLALPPPAEPATPAAPVAEGTSPAAPRRLSGRRPLRAAGAAGGAARLGGKKTRCCSFTCFIVVNIKIVFLKERVIRRRKKK